MKREFLKRKRGRARKTGKVSKTAGIIMGCVLAVFLIGATGTKGGWNGKILGNGKVLENGKVLGTGKAPENEKAPGNESGWDSGRKEEKPLEFFSTMCHDQKGFCFDGLSIADSYELFKKRLAATEYTENIEIKMPESEEEVYFDVVVDVLCLDGYPGAKGSVIYRLYKGQFFQGELQAEFLSYHVAKDYIEERMDAVSVYRDKEYEKKQNRDGITDGGWWVWETGRRGSTLEGLYVDPHHTYLKFYAGEDVKYKGHVRILFGENINPNWENWLEESAFFSPDETEDAETGDAETDDAEIDDEKTDEEEFAGNGLSGGVSRTSIGSLEEVCQYSDTIVKARYISRSEWDTSRTIYVFEPEEDFTGTVEEPYLHLHGAPSGRFQKGESYYLFLKTSRHSFYPHIMYAQVGSFSEREVENGEVERYSLSRKELEELPQCLREMVSKGICPPVEKRESFEEAYANTDAIYRVKVAKTSRENSFVQIGEGELLEKIRMRYKRGARMFHKKCSGFLLPIDAELGEEFFLLERYDKEEERYTIYSWDHFIYRVDSEEGRYIQAQLDAGKEEVFFPPTLLDYEPLVDERKRAPIYRVGSVVRNYFACNGWEDPEGTCYGLEYLECGEQYTMIIMIKKGYPEVCEGLRSVLPEDDSWRIEECDLNYKELEKIQQQVWDDYKNMLSGTSIYSKDCAVHVSFDWNYRHVMPAIYLSIPEEYAPYIILRETCRVSAVPGGTLEEWEKFIPREWYDLTCGYRLRR